MSEILFYSPVKPPDEQRASGLPRVAALIQRALRMTGADVYCPELPLTYDPQGDAKFQIGKIAECQSAASRLLDILARRPDKPCAWVSYHSYYKSPDLVGPMIARALAIPYLIVEASVAPRRAEGPWARYHALAVDALRAADIVIATTPRDAIGLRSFLGNADKVVNLPPFIDVAPFLGVERKSGSGPIRILAAGSMSDARKLESYRILFDAVERLPAGQAALDIAGDGEHRAQIEARAASVKAKGRDVTMRGQVPHIEMPSFFSAGDIFAWPGIGEAYGLTYLEAQAAGLPVVAANHGGVGAVVRDGVSGILADADNSNAFATALTDLVGDSTRRVFLGQTARSYVLSEHTLEISAARFAKLLQTIA